MKKHKTIVWCYKVEENFHIKTVNQTCFVTMTTNITRKEHLKNYKDNYRKIK